jgi:hypothetical protein
MAMSNGLKAGVAAPIAQRRVSTSKWKGGAGRFENASGATTWLAELDLDEGTYDLVADGLINY